MSDTPDQQPIDRDAVELAPCPFCGCEASTERFVSLERSRWSAGCLDENCIGFQSLTTFAREREAVAAWNRRAPPPAEPTEAMVDRMVQRFLGWPLPATFNPDGGIRFDRERVRFGGAHWPVGTNLLDAGQAREMVRHMLGDHQPPRGTVAAAGKE